MINHYYYNIIRLYALETGIQHSHNPITTINIFFFNVFILHNLPLTAARYSL